MGTVKRFAITLLLIGLPWTGPAQTAATRAPAAAGAGAFPLSFTHSSAWFTQRENENEKVLIALFIFQGTPGWLNKKTDFQWKVNQDPATIDMVVGDAPIHAKYWRDTDEIEILGTRYERQVSILRQSRRLYGSRAPQRGPAATQSQNHRLQAAMLLAVALE